MNYRAVVFDFDGTIIDTEQHLFETINHYLKMNGKTPISIDYYRASIGGAASELHAYLENEMGVEATEELYASHHTQSVYLPMIDNISRLMDKLDKKKIPMAIATSSSRANIQPTLDALGLTERIPVIVGREDVEDVKPAPDLYLKAVQELNFNPSSCLAIEDSVNGATAAERAGLGVVVNTNPMTSLMNFDALQLAGMNMTADQIENEFFK